jgi:hypothetical protein
MDLLDTEDVIYPPIIVLGDVRHDTFALNMAKVKHRIAVISSRKMTKRVLRFPPMIGEAQ